VNTTGSLGLPGIQVFERRAGVPSALAHSGGEQLADGGGHRAGQVLVQLGGEIPALQVGCGFDEIGEVTGGEMGPADGGGPGDQGDGDGGPPPDAEGQVQDGPGGQQGGAAERVAGCA
jgi:hypothetical protein